MLRGTRIDALNLTVIITDDAIQSQPFDLLFLGPPIHHSRILVVGHNRAPRTQPLDIRRILPAENHRIRGTVDRRIHEHVQRTDIHTALIPHVIRIRAPHRLISDKTKTGRMLRRDNRIRNRMRQIQRADIHKTPIHGTGRSGRRLRHGLQRNRLTTVIKRLQHTQVRNTILQTRRKTRQRHTVTIRLVITSNKTLHIRRCGSHTNTPKITRPAAASPAAESHPRTGPNTSHAPHKPKRQPCTHRSCADS